MVYGSADHRSCILTFAATASVRCGHAGQSGTRWTAILCMGSVGHRFLHLSFGPRRSSYSDVFTAPARARWAAAGQCGMRGRLVTSRRARSLKPLFCCSGPREPLQLLGRALRSHSSIGGTNGAFVINRRPGEDAANQTLDRSVNSS